MPATSAWHRPSIPLAYTRPDLIFRCFTAPFFSLGTRYNCDWKPLLPYTFLNRPWGQFNFGIENRTIVLDRSWSSASWPLPSFVESPYENGLVVRNCIITVFLLIHIFNFQCLDKRSQSRFISAFCISKKQYSYSATRQPKQQIFLNTRIGNCLCFLFRLVCWK